MLERIERGERIERFETRRRRKDGEIIEVSLTVSPVRDDAGRLCSARRRWRATSPPRSGRRRR